MNKYGDYCSSYFPDFVRLQLRQNIWQFSGVVLPPECHGVIWSASISESSKCFLQWVQIPCCLSYASRFILSVNALILRYFSLWVRTYSWIPDFFITSSSCIRWVISVSSFFESNAVSLNWLYRTPKFTPFNSFREFGKITRIQLIIFWK